MKTIPEKSAAAVLTELQTPETLMASRTPMEPEENIFIDLGEINEPDIRRPARDPQRDDDDRDEEKSDASLRELLAERRRRDGRT